MFYSLIALIFATSFLCCSESQEVTTQTIEKMLSLHEKDSIQDWKQIMAEVAKELSQTLQPASSGKTVNEALTILIDSPNTNITQIPKVRENDWKELYLVKVNDTPRYVLKLYKTDSALFPSDFWGQWCSSHLPLHQTDIAQVHNAGKLSIDSADYFFLLETYMEGNSFALVKTKDAFKRLGISLKEFHTVSTTIQAPLSFPFLCYLDETINQGIGLLDENDRQWIKPLSLYLQDQMEEKSLPRSYVHGDPNFANFLLQKERVSLIDFEAAGQFINANCQGLGTPLFDLIPLLDYLDNLSSADLKNSFLEGYGPLPYDEEAQLYFRLYDVMSALNWFNGAKPQMSSERIIQVQETIRKKLDQLQKLTLRTSAMGMIGHQNVKIHLAFNVF